MGKINILEPNVFNMISAGEVVERPSSVVKELVENSIDAGATQVDVYVEEGGTRRIQVSDNGIGILKEDMRSAFLPHATSKLKNITDLDSLSTLGFRGEALASIASVSEVQLISKSRSQNLASKIVLSGGKVVEECDASREEGSIINVDSLFFNTPARLKFLKKASSELHYIQDTVKMLILANPSVRISLSSEDGELISSEGGTLLDAIYSVYGAKVADNLLEIKPNENSLIKVSGYTSKVDYTKPNRTYQTIIVNGRAVEDVTIQTAVEKAYTEFLMKRTYPMFILDMLIPFEDVDANVHPSKTEVRFRDKQSVFSAVFHAVKDCINNSLGDITFGFDKQRADGNTIEQNNNAQPAVKHEFVQSVIDTARLYGGKTTPKNADKQPYDLSSFEMDIRQIEPIRTPIYKPNTFEDSPIGEIFSTDFAHSYSADNSQSNSTDSAKIENTPNNYSNTEQELRIFDGKIIGQVFDTYLLCERDNLLYLIDQHAAHERILYDEIVNKFCVEHKQSLLIPYKLSLTGEEEEYFERILRNLEQLGFEIEKSSDANYLITAVPEPVASVRFDKFFADLFSNMLDEGSLSLENLLKDKLCQQACKAAIKGGESLSRIQIERVLQNYVDENGDLPAKCPHGRPAVIAITKQDIEKLFKRIV